MYTRTGENVIWSTAIVEKGEKTESSWIIWKNNGSKIWISLSRKWGANGGSLGLCGTLSSGFSGTRTLLLGLLFWFLLLLPTLKMCSSLGTSPRLSALLSLYIISLSKLVRLHSLNTASMLIALKIPFLAVTVTLCVNFTKPIGTRIFDQMLFWVCLWGHFWMRLAFDQIW